MKEIGGYIELDTYHLPMLHQGAIALNCGRNALAYVLRARGIRRIALPHYICDSVTGLCAREGVEMRFYHVNERFEPMIDSLAADEWLYAVNYFGQLGTERLTALAERFERVIVDQAQAYFEAPIPGADTLYTCRKFFGVPDGAFLYTDTRLNETLPQDESFDRMRFLLGRFERSASQFYSEYTANNHLFAAEPLKRMSRLTDNLLHGIDYPAVEKQRRENFERLHAQLSDINELKVQAYPGPFAYPLLVKNGERIKKALIARRIFVPTLWPNVLSDPQITETERRLAGALLILPCDQRYTVSDMDEMAAAVVEEIACLAQQAKENGLG